MTRFAIKLIILLCCGSAQNKMQDCKIPNAGAGKCVTLHECDPLYQLQGKNPKTPEEDAFFRQSVGSCGRKPFKLEVCCPPLSRWAKLIATPVLYPESPVSIDRTHYTLKPVNDSNNDSIKESIKYGNNDSITDSNNDSIKDNTNDSNNDSINDSINKTREPVPLSIYIPMDNDEETCGIESNNEPRIVGGNATQIDEYPWTALLEYEPKQFKCGGSLISRTHVLTAAHCLYTTPSKVRLSEYNLTSEPTDEVDTSGGGKDYITVTIVDVDSTTLHPNHRFKTGTNDIGLIKMKQRVEYGDFIKPICLPTKDYRETHFTASTKFIVAGWGSDNEFQNTEVKRSVYVPYVPNLCKDGQICAGGEEGKDSCSGDSGGPLMYEEGSTFVLVGIVSFGYSRCGSKDFPAVYTYVYHYLDWIQNTTKYDSHN